MDDKQDNRLKRADKVNLFLTTNAAQLTATPLIGTTLQPALAAAITKTSNDDMLATMDTTGEAVNKSTLAKNLVEEVFHISSGLVSYADDTNDFLLMNMVQFVISDIENFRDDRLLQFCDFVFDKANDATIKAALIAEHNVTATEIAELQTNTNAYRLVIAAPAFDRSTKVAYGKLVDRDLTDIDDILNRIRIKMRTYRKTNRLLYDTFVATDTVDDTGSHNSAVFNGIVPPSTSAKITAITFSAGNQIKFENLAQTSLIFTIFKYGSPIGSDLTVAANATTTITMGAMASDGDELHVKNTSNSLTGTYKVSF